MEQTKFEQELQRFSLWPDKWVETKIDGSPKGQELVDRLIAFSEEYSVPLKDINVEFIQAPGWWSPYVRFRATIPKTQDELESELNTKYSQLEKEQRRQNSKDALEYERLKKKFEKGT